MKVLAVCGLGIGSSVILKISVGKILDDIGVKNYSIDVADIGTAKSIPFDMAVTNVELADVLKKGIPLEKHLRVVTVNNFVDKDEMKSKISACLKEIGEI